jgi:hypothetical protein
LDTLRFALVRCAHGKRNAAGALEWDFHVVGNAGQSRTSGVVQAVVAVLWDDTLSLFYGDLTRGVIRHAWRHPGDSHWRYELLARVRQSKNRSRGTDRSS